MALLLVCPAAAQELSGQDSAHYRNAFGFAERGEWPQAYAAAAQATDQRLMPVLEWLDWGREESGADWAQLSQFLSAHPNWPALGSMRRNAERRMPSSLGPAEVAAWFERFPPLTGLGLIRQIEALTALGRDARATLAAAWPSVRLGSSEQAQVIERLGSLLDRGAHWTRLDTLIWNGRYDEARAMLPLVDADRRALADARIRLATRGSGVDDAVRAVPASLTNDPGLIYERVRWRRRSDLTGGAIELLAQQPADPAHAEQWWTERHVLARDLLNGRDYAGAYALVTDVQQAGGVPLADSEFLAGWLALRFLDQPQQAAAHFQRLYENVTAPISLARGAYWAGRAAEAQDDAAGAQRWYQTAAAYSTAFYGQLAADRIGLPTVSPLPQTPTASPEREAAFRADERVQIVSLLASASQPLRVDQFLTRLMEDANDPDGFVLVGRLAEALNRTPIGVRAAKRAVSLGAQLTSLNYPAVPLSTADTRPEPALVLALIRQESEFHQEALSSANAHGLMQLLPSTASIVARDLGIEHSTAMLTRDAGHNIRLGSSHLADLIEQFDGSYILALVAYNAGPSRAAEWRRTLGSPEDVDGMIDWIERIPFGETRNYVQRILETTQVYRWLLSGRTQTGGLNADLLR